MNGKELLKMGFPPGPAIGAALRAVPRAQEKLTHKDVKSELKKVLDDPASHREHPYFADVARLLLEQSQQSATFVERSEPAPYRVWGGDLDASALAQMSAAVRLPVAVSGALMPDAHVGY